MELTITEILDRNTRRIAEIMLDMPGNRLAVARPFRNVEDWILLQHLKSKLQPLADSVFEEGTVVVKPQRVTSGSVIATFMLIATAKFVYDFVKDYKDLKEGLAELTKDIKRAETRLVNIVEDYFPSSATAKPPRRIVVSLAAVTTGVLVNEVGSYLVSTFWLGILNGTRFPSGTSPEVMSEWHRHSLLSLASLTIIGLLFVALGAGVTGYMARRFELSHAIAFWLTSLVAEITVYVLCSEAIFLKLPLQLVLGTLLLSLPVAVASAALVKLVRGLGSGD